MTERSRRLNGWKAIGGYFGRDRSTAMRWARERGLPIHRTPGGKLSSVFAFSDELDQWLNNDTDFIQNTALEGAKRPEKNSFSRGPVMAWLGWRHAVPGIAGLMVLATIATTVNRLSGSWQSPMRIQVMALQSNHTENASIFALHLRDDITDALTKSGIENGTSTGRLPFFRSAQPNVLVKGTVTQADGNTRVDCLLDDKASGVTLWSARFEQKSGAGGQLEDEVTAAVADAASTIQDIRRQKGIRLAPQTVALIIRGTELVGSPQLRELGGPRKIFEEVVLRAPRLALGHAMLALAQVNEARFGLTQLKAAAFAQGRRQAAKAIAIDPTVAGAAYDTLYIIARTEHPRKIVQAEDWVLQGMVHDPKFPFLARRECRILNEVGRAKEAIGFCERALALRPFAGPIGYNYADALSIANEPAHAFDAIETAARYNPNDSATRMVRIETAMFGGHQNTALSLLHNVATRPPPWSEKSVTLLSRYLIAVKTGNARERDAVAAAIEDSGLHGDLPFSYAVMALTSLNKVDGAFRLLDSRLLNREIPVQSTFLFQPVTRPLRADPRFWSLAARLGLAQYWTARNKWPDMCGREMPLATCKVETQRALKEFGKQSTT